VSPAAPRRGRRSGLAELPGPAAGDPHPRHRFRQPGGDRRTPRASGRWRRSRRTRRPAFPA
jgi:hypothetical protein